MKRKQSSTFSSSAKRRPSTTTTSSSSITNNQARGLEGAVYTTCIELLRDLEIAQYPNIARFKIIVESLSSPTNLLNALQNPNSDIVTFMPISFIQQHIPKYIPLLTICQPKFQESLITTSSSSTTDKSVASLLASSSSSSSSSSNNNTMSSVMDVVKGLWGNEEILTSPLVPDLKSLPDFDEAIEESIKKFSSMTENGSEGVDDNSNNNKRRTTKNRKGCDNLRAVAKKMRENKELYSFAKKMYNHMRDENVQKAGILGCINTLQKELNENMDVKQLEKIGSQANDIVQDILPEEFIQNIQNMQNNNENPEKMIGDLLNPDLLQKMLFQDQ